MIENIVNNIELGINKLARNSLQYAFPEEILSIQDINVLKQCFLNLNAKLSDLRCVLCEITLPVNQNILQGLNHFFTELNNLNVPINTKNLNLKITPTDSQTDEFLAAFNNFLNSVANSGLENLYILDPANLLNPDHCQAIVDNIREINPNTRINLPAIYADTTMQMELDDLYCERQHQFRVEALLGTEVASNQEIRVDIPNQIRRRSKDRHNGKPFIDTEIFSELELEEEPEQEEITEHVNIATKSTQIKRYSYTELLDECSDFSSMRLLPDNLLLSKNDFINFLDSIFINNNTFVTETALKYLLNNFNYFKTGIDYEHLPGGFKIIPEDGGKQTLDFSDANLTPSSLLAPLVREINKPSLVMTGEKFAQFFPETSDKLKILANGKYLRQITELFHQNSLFLIRFDDTTLNEFFSLLEDANNIINITKFNFIKNNFLQISELKNQNIKDDNNSRIRFILENFFGRNTKKVIDLCWKLTHSYEEQQRSFIARFPAFIDHLQKIEEKFEKLHSSELQNLTEIFFYYDIDGLSYLEENLNNPEYDIQILQDLHTAIFPYTENFSRIVFNAEFKKIVSVLSGIKQDSAKYRWLITLLSKHYQSGYAGDLADLINAFNVFSNKVINEYQLNFYPNIEFAHAISLPLALSRIETILQKTRSEDRDVVWNYITSLDLTSHGAIKALAECGCSFVLPQMQINKVNYFANDNSFVFPSKLQKILIKEDKTKVDENDFDTIVCRFYRYLSQQKYRMPLSFYEDMITKIYRKDWALLDKNKILCILLGSTCQENKPVEEETISSWNRIIEILDLKDFSMVGNTVRSTIISNLYALKYFAPPALCCKLLVFNIKNANIGLNVFKVMGDAKKMADTMKAINEKLQSNAFFVGMRFYQETDFKPYKDITDSLIYKHALFVETLIKAFEESIEEIKRENTGEITQEEQRLFQKCLNNLIAIISNFKLLEYETHVIQVTYKKIEEALKTKRVHLFELFEILRDISSNEGLDYPDFSLLCDKVLTINSNEKNQIHYIIQEDYSENFPEGYFNRQLTENLLSDFNEKEKAPINKILKKFNETDFQKIADSIKQVLNKYERENERFEFLEKINTLLVEPIIESDKFITLLNNIQNSPLDYTICIFNNIEKKSETINGTLQKAAFYFAYRNLFINREKPKSVTKLELQGLLIDFLSFSDLNELATADVEVSNSKFYYHIKLALKEDNIAELKTLLSRFFASHAKENHPEIAKLYEKITSRRFNVSYKIQDSFQKGIKKLGSIANKVLKKEDITNAQSSSSYTIDGDYKNPAAQAIETLLLHSRGFVFQLNLMMQNVIALANNYQSCKQIILNFVGRLLQLKEYNSQDIYKIVYTIKKTIFEFRDENLLRTFITLPITSTDEFSLIKLVELLNNPCFENNLNVNRRHLILKIITILVNNNREINLDDLDKLLALIDINNQSSEIYYQFLNHAYAKPPYPEIKLILEMINLDIINNAQPDLDSLLENLQSFDKTPVDREVINGFHLDEAQKQNALLQGSKLTYDNLNRLENAVNEVKDVATDEILLALQNTQDLPNEQLLAFVAELLYRTKGLPKKDNNGKRIYGRSFEINTTQYLAILGMLNGGDIVLSQIATGEGKTRIMMIMAACQFLKGHTVDFVTSNVQLALRDYLEYRQFFVDIGAQTSLIYQNSPIEDYKIKGINFSDFQNLNLFRNKVSVASNAKLNNVLDKNPENRALLLDEGDVVFFDMARRRCNFSELSDTTLLEKSWIYDYLIGYFSQNDPQILHNYYENVGLCNKKFIDYVRTFNEEHAEFFSSISTMQLETWHDVAVKALSLQFNQDFVIAKDINVHTKNGVKNINFARLRVDNREDENATLSFGLHQCLHARLNLLHNKINKLHKNRNDEALKQAIDNEDPHLIKTIESCVDGFHYEPQKEIMYSTTSKDFLDQYKEGKIYSVSGTFGDDEERNEINLLYGKTKKPVFLNVPRHAGLRRVDLPFSLVPNKKEQLKQYVEEIRLARLHNQPVVIICEHDAESNEVFEYLQEQFPDDTKLHLIHSQTDRKTESNHVKNIAGSPNAITVSTGMIGRGADVLIHGEAAERGLKILMSNLPHNREYKQWIGRAGRFGAKGESRLILNKEWLQKKYPINFDGDFYCLAEKYLHEAQTIIRNKEQISRICGFIINDYRIQFSQKFFKEFLPQFDAHLQEQMKQYWANFLKETDNKYQVIINKLEDLDPNKLDFKLIEDAFKDYENFLQKEWNTLKENVSREIKAEENNLLQSLNFDIHLELQQDICDFFKEIAIPKNSKFAIPVVSEYDKALDGRAKIYKRPFTELKAILTGKRNPFADLGAKIKNVGLWFANLRALIKGHMTFAEFFLGKDFQYYMEGKITFREFWTGVYDPNKVEGVSHTPAEVSGLEKQTKEDHCEENKSTFTLLEALSRSASANSGGPPQETSKNTETMSIYQSVVEAQMR